MRPIRWRKSSYSAQNGTCVELADDGGRVLIRNSNAPDAGTLALTREQSRALIAAAKAGDLDHLS